MHTFAPVLNQASSRRNELNPRGLGQLFSSIPSDAICGPNPCWFSDNSRPGPVCASWLRCATPNLVRGMSGLGDSSGSAWWPSSYPDNSCGTNPCSWYDDIVYVRQACMDWLKCGQPGSLAVQMSGESSGPVQLATGVTSDFANYTLSGGDTSPASQVFSPSGGIGPAINSALLMIGGVVIVVALVSRR
jgi:hypothetical protein